MNGYREPVEDRLNTCLEAVLGGRQSLEVALAQNPELADELRGGLEAAMWLSARRGALEPRPGFVAASRRRLVARRFRTRQVHKHAPGFSFFGKALRLLTNRFVFQASLVILALMALLVGNVFSAAAQTTLPGDFLYPVKTFSEGVQITFALNPPTKARLHLEFARRRVMEVETLVLEGRIERAAETLENFDRQAGQAVTVLQGLRVQDPEATRRLAFALNRLLVDQSQVIDRLSTRATEGENPRLATAVQASQENLLEMHAMLLPLGLPSEEIPTIMTPQPGQTASSIPEGGPVLRPSQAGGGAAAVTPTRRPSLTPRPTNTHRPTMWETNTPRPSKTPKPTFTPRVENTRRPTPRPPNTHHPPSKTPRTKSP